MAVDMYLGYPPPYITEWIKSHSQPSELGTPLYFEGQEAGATVAMIAWNDNEYAPEQHLHCNLECSTDGMNTWSVYDGEIINLDNCAEKRVYFRAPEGQPNTYGFYDYENYIFHCFKLEKAVKAGGNIQFLLDFTGIRIDVPTYAFYKIFGMSYYDDETGEETGWCRTLTQAPLLPATILASNCYVGMFSRCTSLTQAPALPAITLVDHCYQYIFEDCASLTSMNVSFTAWSPINATTSWMTNAGSQATGLKTFTCPAALPDTTGESNIPSGWTRVEK